MKLMLYRICFFVPIILFVAFVILVVMGIIANMMHAGPLFYCGVYCKAVVSIIIIAIAGTVFCQIKACK
jgi:hypothetical protein